MRSKLKSDTFYKIILADKINLRIPNKFIRGHRKNILLNDALLTVPDNNVWLMSLMVSGNGNVCLNNGWPEFSQHYSLDTGHLLLFNHLGESAFHVRIFDQTCCEIDYKMDQDHTPMVVVDTGDQVLAGKERTKSIRAFEWAKSFKSDKPFYSVKINSAYIQSWGLYVPVGFMRRYLTNGDKKCVDCVLKVSSDGRKWGPVLCREYKSYGKMYGDNWKKFRDDNHLAVGDVCVFELMDEIEKVFKVSVFRDS